MEMSWSHTPSSVWWALEASSSISLDGRNSPQPLDPQESMRARSPTLRPRPRMPGKKVTNVYDYADGEEDSEEGIQHWVLEQPSRGVIRVYQPGSTYSELVRCTLETTADTITARCLAKELYVHYGSGHQQSVRFDDHPLEIQNQFLRSLGYTDLHHIQLQGLSTELGPLFKFVTGYEEGKRPEEKVQLACTLKVKEMNGFGVWCRRFCVLCGARLFIFSTSRPKGKPSLVLDLTGGKMVEHKTKKSYYCVKVCASRREVLLSFDSRLEQSRWLERAAKVVSKHPLEANLSGHSLERVPKYFFLNYYLVAMNLSRNIMKENFSHTVTSLGGQVRMIGWINDLSYFHHLVSLSLSDNQLNQFPVSLCTVKTLQELDVSQNRIKVIPQEIQHLLSLTTLLLHSNHLTSLPRGLVDLKQLSTLVIAFNRFIELPPLLKEVPSLSILIISGNTISTIPDDIILIENLTHFDCRLNPLKSPLPTSVRDLSHLVRLNLRGTTLRVVDTSCFPLVEDLNCADNRLSNLVLYEGPLRQLMAANNNIRQFSVAPTCTQLTSINVSRNQLTSLPEPLTGLRSLQKLNVSHNKLTHLPTGIFTIPELQVLQASNNKLKDLPVTFADGCGLQVIDLHGNQLTSLPQQLIMRAPHLHTLNVSSNQLSVLPVVSPHGSGPSLSTLLAADNRLGDGVLATISCCKKLKVLHLAYNLLENILPSAFVHLKQLEYLNLSGNSLTSFPSLPSCFHLHSLFIHSSLLTALPEDTPPLRQLMNLDLAGNRLTHLLKLSLFSQLKYLDLSDNLQTKIKENDVDKLKSLSRCVLEGGVSIHSDARMMSHVESSGTTANTSSWKFGSAQTTGLSGCHDCTVQVKIPSLHTHKDGLFAILDGGRSADAPAIIQKKLANVLMEEFSSQGVEPRAKDTPLESLQYLTHTFLTAHQMLGDTGRSYGCSVVLCHLHMLRSKKLVLNVANAGLGEAILCRRGNAVPLTMPHSPATCKEERERVKEAGGFISQDYRVNGTCGTSRLVGCYHLAPEVIPTPSSESISLQSGDEYIILGSESLWKYISHKAAVNIVCHSASPSSAARKLRDLAVGYGCKTDVSVIVVQLNVGDGVAPIESLFHSISDLQSDQTPDENVEFTNIDDILSDTEDDLEPTQESTWNGVRLRKKKAVPHAEGRDIDRMILDAVSSPPTSISPEMKSTNIDDILSPSPPHPSTQHTPHNIHPSTQHTPHNIHPSTQHTPHNIHPSHVTTPSRLAVQTGPGSRSGGRAVSTHSHPSPPTLPMYPAQTIPRDAAGSRTKGGATSPPLPPSQAINYEMFKDSFEVTQSAPFIPTDQSNGSPEREGKGVRDDVGFGGSLRREKEDKSGWGRRRDSRERQQRGNLTRTEVRGEDMEGYLSALNQTMMSLDSDSALREPQYGTKIQRRLSYVEHSYKQLTNSVYSEGVNVGQEESDDW